MIDTITGGISGLHAADLDGDGDADLICPRFYQPPMLGWYANQGGTFSAVQPFPHQPLYAAYDALTLDLGADNDLDVIVAVDENAPQPGGDHQVQVESNNGNGTFTPGATLYPMSAGRQQLEKGDLEGDGDLDLFVRRNGGAVYVSIYQSGQLANQSASFGGTAGVNDFRVADFDGDGDGDLLAANSASGPVAWFAGFAFGAGHVLDASVGAASGVAAADFDGDGDVDVVARVGPSGQQQLFWYENLGAGTFGARQPISTMTAGNTLLDLLCPDIDGDGHPDVLAAEPSGAAWYRNDGQGHFGVRQVVTSNTNLVTTSMEVADVDGDGALDVVLGSFVNGGGNRLAWFRNQVPVFARVCTGDGTATPCPCGNSGSAGNGCASSVDAGGGSLSATGSPSIANDSFVLVGTHMPNSVTLYFQGTTAFNGGNGVVLGDGLRCAGGVIVRLGQKLNVAGASSYPSGADVPISIRGNNVAGNVRTYQCWYRNAAAFCTPSTFNFTNGLQTTWTP